ncbi:MAG: response regulator [Anaerolineae bacterium]|nr:response regulator [Anaerolineae bacterium]
MPTILYAEDDVEHREMMRVILKDTDITLVEATNGQEALQKIQHQHPDLVLLDLFMPKLDGHGVMEALKSDPETSHIPIIVLSAWSTGDNRKRARSAGALEFIAKPYDPVELVSVVRDYLAGRIGSPQQALSQG